MRFSALEIALGFFLSVALAGCGGGSSGNNNNAGSPSIGTTSLPAAKVNVAYNQALTATGGTPPYTWTVSTGSLPAGLALVGSTGAITGTPSAAGSNNFTIQVADSKSKTATQTLSIAVTAPLSITTTALPNGTVGSVYDNSLAASGGSGPYTWSLASGSVLPAGLSLSSAGVVSGTPGAAASSSPQVTVSDSASNTASATVTILINPVTTGLPDGAYAFNFNGTTPRGTYALAGTFQLANQTFVSGIYDENVAPNLPIVEQPLSGVTLKTGANGLNTMVLTLQNGQTITFSFSSPGSITSSAGGGSDIWMAEFDDTTGTGNRGSGLLKLYTGATAPIATADIKGNYAFHFNGTTPAGNPASIVGSFVADGNGHVLDGSAEKNDSNVASEFTRINGTYSIDAQGRGTLSIHLDPSGGGPIYNFGFYPASPNNLLVISTDQSAQGLAVDAPLVSGRMVAQTGAPFSVASFAGNWVLEQIGASSASPDILSGIATPDGNGNLAITYDEMNSGGLQSARAVNWSYELDPAYGASGGRLNVESGSGSGTKLELVIYLISSTQGYEITSSNSAGSGLLEQQTLADGATSFSDADFAGDYSGGSKPLPLAGGNNQVSLLGADGAGNITINSNSSTSRGLTSGSTVTGTYAVDATGRVPVATADKQTRIFYLVSPTKAIELSGEAGGFLGSFEQ